LAALVSASIINSMGLAVPLTSVVLAALAAPDVVVLAPAADNTLFSTGGETSSGAGPAVYCGRTGGAGGGTRQRAVLAFDVATVVPAGATIRSATLTLTLESVGSAGGSETLTLHRVLAAWGEGASEGSGGRGGPAAPGDATWLHTFHPDHFWATEGGVFDAAPSADAVVGETTGPYSWTSTDRAVADVQHWLDAPSASFGWLVLGNESALGTARRFHSRESDADDARPALVVEFDPPPPCDGDVDGDRTVDTADVLAVLAAWGACPPKDPCPADADGSGDVDVADLLAVLAAWGPCPTRP
jgi:hypothetical protein